MSKTKTIELSEPIKDHRGTITKIVLREPRYSDFTDLGMEPRAGPAPSPKRRHIGLGEADIA